MKKILTVQVTTNGHRDLVPSETIISRTINGLKKKIKVYTPIAPWICLANNKELVILELNRTKHIFAVLRYEEHEVVGDD